MSKLIDVLQPKRITDSKKIRLGPNEDGGYVVSECILKNIDSLFTYGSGDFINRPENIGFEKEFIKKYKKPVYLFDHTIGLEDYKDDLINFFNEGLGFEDKCDTFFNHYSKLNIKNKVLLKIDVEGDEYSFFEKTDVLELSKLVSGMCIEFHGLNIKDSRERFINVCSKIQELFVLNHIHGNNWGGVFDYEDYTIPIVLELTFVNKNIADNIQDCLDDYPIKNLDYPNKPGEKDINLNFIKRKFVVNHYNSSYYKKTSSEIINAGTSDKNTKIIKLDKKYTNPAFYPRKFERWPDQFFVELQGDSLFVKRTDVKNGGWGESLLIDIEFETENTKETPDEQKIPRVIYQTFETYDVPKRMYKAIKSWIDLNPDYEHYFFNEEDRYKFIEKYFDKKVLQSYLSLIPGAFKADLWRCCVLYEKGGVYADADMICLKSLNNLIKKNDEFIIPRDDPMSKKFLSNGFIACTPKHDFLKEQIERIVKNVENLKQCYYLEVSGPCLLGKSVNNILGKNEETEYELGYFKEGKHLLKIMQHDWKSKTFKFDNQEFIFTEYPGKSLEMQSIGNPTFYSLCQKNIVYQQIPREIYFTTYDSTYINDYMIKSFTSKNKYWKLNYYSDTDCLNFFKKENSKFKNELGIDALSFFNALENGGERSDFWRYCIIYLYGGFYTDADTYCNISLDQWIKHYDLILGIEALLPEDEARKFGMDKIGKTYGNSVISVCNWTFAAKREHSFLKDLILDIVHDPIQSNVLLNTGPGRFTKHAMKYFDNDIKPLQDNNAIVKNASILFDINKFGSNQSHSNAYKNYNNPLETIDSAYVVHLFDGSWRCKKNQDIKKYKSNLGVSHNLTLDKINENEYIGVARLDKDTSRTQFLKKIGDCRTLLEIKFDRNLDIIEEKEKPILNFDACAKFEDYRVFYFQNKKFYSVSYIDIEFNTKVAILDQNFTFLGDVILSDRKFNTAWNKIWEKNWLFFEHNNDLYFIYSTTPRYILYKCINFDKLIFKTHIDIEWQFHGPTDNLYFGDKVTTGGSVNPIYLKEKNIYLYMIHTKLYNKRRYNHYFVALDNHAKPIQFYNRPLINEYTEEGYFFISSMILESEYILISGGLEDNQNFTWRLSKDFIFKKIIN